MSKYSAIVAALVASILLFDVGEKEAGQDANEAAKDGQLGGQRTEGADEGHRERSGERHREEAGIS